VLAVLSALGGLMGIPHASWLEHWLEPVIPGHALSASVNPAMEWVLMGVSVVGAVFGMVLAWRIYSDLKSAEALKARWAGVHRLLENKWYVDELYEAAIIRPIQMLSEILWKVFDVKVIDQAVLGLGRVSAWTGQRVRILQTGSTQVYAFMLLVGLVVTLGYIIYGLV
jgi:NADH-quinone oxidoreductase subunit L